MTGNVQRMDGGEKKVNRRETAGENGDFGVIRRNNLRDRNPTLSSMMRLFELNELLIMLLCF